MRSYPWAAGALVLACASVLVAPVLAKELKISTQLPDAVDETLKARFPNAEISKLDVTEENGVMVYDIEFSDGAAEKETDIAADGTMLEWTLVIEARAIPAAAMKSIRKAAAGARLGRLERIELGYETEDGKVVQLPETQIRFAAELSKGGKNTEVIVDRSGAVVERPDWGDGKK